LQYFLSPYLGVKLSSWSPKFSTTLDLLNYYYYYFVNRKEGELKGWYWAVPSSYSHENQAKYFASSLWLFNTCDSIKLLNLEGNRYCTVTTSEFTGFWFWKRETWMVSLSSLDSETLQHPSCFLSLPFVLRWSSSERLMEWWKSSVFETFAALFISCFFMGMQFWRFLLIICFFLLLGRGFYLIYLEKGVWD